MEENGQSPLLTMLGTKRKPLSADHLTWQALVTFAHLHRFGEFDKILPHLSHLSPWQNLAKFVIFVIACLSGHKCLNTAMPSPKTTEEFFGGEGWLFTGYDQLLRIGFTQYTFRDYVTGYPPCQCS